MHDLVDIGADADQHAGADLIEEAEGRVHEPDDRREAEERRDALARHDAVVDLEHEQRPGEGQDVHDAAEDDDPAKRAPAIVDRRHEFRSPGIIRPFPPPEHELTSALRSPGFFTCRSGSIAPSLRKNQRKHCERRHRPRLIRRNENDRGRISLPFRRRCVGSTRGPALWSTRGPRVASWSARACGGKSSKINAEGRTPDDGP